MGMYPVELHGQQVMLREFTSGDLADSLRIVGDDEVTNWLSFDSRSEDEDVARILGSSENRKAPPGRAHARVAACSAGVQQARGQQV